MIVLLTSAQRHGGRVVPVEKNADFLIADPDRNDCPPGAHSVKLIEDSVKHGCFQLPERYHIGAPPEPGNNALGASVAQKTRNPRKHFRNPFTPQDDSLLANFVTSQPEAQHSMKAWEELAEFVSPSDFSVRC